MQESNMLSIFTNLFFEIDVFGNFTDSNNSSKQNIQLISLLDFIVKVDKSIDIKLLQ